MDTIFAVSSGVGRSAIAVIRISGPGCQDAAAALAGRSFRPRQASLATLRDPISGDVLDQALCLAFPGPHSFTGEDCLELHLHGGRAVVQSVLTALQKRPGFRAAEPGEFTRRAFANGKMGLDSAEGLADLVQADTLLQQRQALAALGGSLHRVVSDWRDRLVSIQAMLEAWLDFPDESEISDALVEEGAGALTSLIGELETALGHAARSEILRDGVKVLIAGPPNAGKSSLLNKLAQREAAIVSDIPGTTRDILEISLEVAGAPVIFIDGAGIRETVDVIETLGIDRVKREAESVQIIIWLTPADDAAAPPPPDWIAKDDVELLTVSSKIDLRLPRMGLGISTLTGEGLDTLVSEIGTRVARVVGSGEHQVQLRQRHMHAVGEALRGLHLAHAQLVDGKAELAVEECRGSLLALASISEPVHSEDVLDSVFSRFCIGK